jgi:hypothetical protein
LLMGAEPPGDTTTQPGTGSGNYGQQPGGGVAAGQEAPEAHPAVAAPRPSVRLAPAVSRNTRLSFDDPNSTSSQHLGSGGHKEGANDTSGHGSGSGHQGGEAEAGAGQERGTGGGETGGGAQALGRFQSRVTRNTARWV